jgi:hypothetical protein
MASAQADLQRIEQPLNFAQALLQDLHSNAALPEGRSAGDVYALDHQQWATFQINYAASSS